MSNNLELICDEIETRLGNDYHHPILKALDMLLIAQLLNNKSKKLREIIEREEGINKNTCICGNCCRSH
jgi:hypothetical protein